LGLAADNRSVISTAGGERMSCALGPRDQTSRGVDSHRGLVVADRLVAAPQHERGVAELAIRAAMRDDCATGGELAAGVGRQDGVYLCCSLLVVSSSAASMASPIAESQLVSKGSSAKLSAAMIRSCS